MLVSTFDDWGIIVVGDACTDDSEACAASFDDPRLSFVNLSRHCGDQSRPNNQGDESARGQYVAFLNHDDLYFPEHLATMVAASSQRPVGDRIHSVSVLQCLVLDAAPIAGGARRSVAVAGPGLGHPIAGLVEAVATVTEQVVRTGDELVADKGYHNKQTVLDVQTLGRRTYISEPDRGRQHWIDQEAACDAVYANRRRIHGDRGQQLMRRRGELLERPNAHVYDTGGMRRTHLRTHPNILKRVLVHARACNLGLWERTLTGVGTPRGLQGRLAVALAIGIAFWVLLHDHMTVRRQQDVDLRSSAILCHRLAAMTGVM